MVVRDTRESRRDKVIHLNAQWRAGWAVLVISVTTSGPIVLGWAWIRLFRRLLTVGDTPGATYEAQATPTA